MMNAKNYTAKTKTDFPKITPKFIGAAAHTRLVENDYIDASRIRVEGHPDQQAVTLTGVVENDAQRMLAISLARQTPGVMTVNDRIAVQ